MPKSRTRRKTKPVSRRRNKAGESRVRETQSAQREAEEKKISPEAYRRRRILGWVLVALGVIVGVQHFGHHLGLYTLVSDGWDDLIAGYPLALLLGIAGAIVLSK